MTTTVGLERLPRPISALLDEAAANLIATANEFDALVEHGAAAALQAIEHDEGDGDRIVHDLLRAVGASRRAGPDRERLITLARALDDVVDALLDLAWFWARRPCPELTDLMLAVRDAARAAARATQALEHSDLLEQRIDRCHDAEREARAELRWARGGLLVRQGDAMQAIAGHDLLRRAERCLNACAQLRDRLRRHALA